jgi:ferredoxin
MGFFNRLMAKGPCEVHFDADTRVEVEHGTSIRDAGNKAGIEIDSFCDGCCSCSTCKVLVREGAKSLSKMNPDEEKVLGKKLVKEGYRLSCQAKVQGTVHVDVPEYF